jgi:DNA-binding response OmpR family regulator
MSFHSSRPDHFGYVGGPGDDGGAGPSRVLLAEDDRELRRMLAGELRKEGFVVTESATGLELLEHLGDSTRRAQPVDLIVSDIRMPGLSGLAMVEGLRSGSRAGNWAIPVILITAFGDAEAHAEARRLGAVLLDKPFDLDDFRVRARSMVDPGAAA